MAKFAGKQLVRLMKIACILFLAVTLLIPPIYGFREARRLSRTKFSKTRGRIIHSGITGAEPLVEVNKAIPMFGPDVRYSFAIDGDDHEGRDLSYAKKASSRREDIERMISAYTVGDIVDVYYDPDDISACYLIDPTRFVVFHLAWAVSCIAIFFLLSSVIWIVI